MFQQATLATRDAKHEPRSLAEQRQEWRAQAVGLLGSDEAVNAMIARSLAGRTTTPAEVTAGWIKARAAQVIATVSAARATWNRTHVLAEALRVVRVTGHAGIDGIAELITDAVRETFHIVNVGRTLQGQAPLAPKDGAIFHFELPGSVQGFISDWMKSPSALLGSQSLNLAS